jgi:hypothetical protein
MSSNSSQHSSNSLVGLDGSHTKVSGSGRHRSQGIFWMGTIPKDAWSPRLDDNVAWIRGQLECGGNTGYQHWQLVFALKRKGSLRTCKSIFGKSGHFEISRSAAANDYVFKEDTRVAGTQFELGNKPFLRNW